jgi:predicted ATPase
LVAATIARMLGLHESAGFSARELLLDKLRERHMLLVIDNFEQVIEAAPLVADLLAECADLQVLVTSRTALRIRAEFLLSVDPLDTPSPNSPALNLEELRAIPSVALFAERARSVDPRFDLDSGNVAAVADICRRLDGLPLAIELAASRARVLPPNILLPRLDQQLTLLADGPRDLPPRQQTLRDTLDWSYQLLDADAQQAFTRLAVFEGGAPLEAAEQVTGASVNVLMTLVDSNLVVASAPEGETRFGFLEMIGAFARERLQETHAVDLTALRAAHATWFMHFAHEAERRLIGAQSGEQDTWIRRLDRDYANLATALRWTLDCGDTERAIEGLWCIHGFLWSTGRTREVDEWAQELRGHEPGLSPRGQTRATYLAGLAAQMRDDLLGAELLMEQALALAKTTEDQRVIGLCLLLLAYSGVRRNGIQWSIARLEASTAAFRAGNDMWGEALTMGGLGEMATLDRDFERAEFYFGEYVSHCRARGDRRGLGQGLQAMGNVHLLKGAYSSAETLFLQAAPLCYTTNNFERLALCLRGLACVAAERHRWARAARLFGAGERAISGATRVAQLDLHERAAGAARAHLGASGFARAHAEGRGYQLRDLVAEIETC